MRNRYSRWRPILVTVLMAGMSFSAGPPLWAGTTEENLKAKLEEFEERLKQLEKNSQERQKSRPETEETMTVQVEELQRQLDILAEEVEKLRSGEQEVELTREQAKTLGLGPSAASIYAKSKGVSIAGYGEMLYENFDDRSEDGEAVDKGASLDFVRMILYAGYRFNEKFLFNSEIEFEHASTDKSGSASVEFAYLDYVASDRFTLRGGLLLIPMGLTNEFHEPNVFLGVQRPETEKRIIPTTWRENGFGALGSAGMFSYRAYVVNGLDAGGFSASGLRGGRQKGSKAKASNLAWVGRLDVSPTPGVFFGGSLYRGGSGQGQFEVEGRDLNVTTTIGEVHAQAQFRGFDFRGLYARSVLDDVTELNQARGLTGENSIAETLQGGYLQGGYNLFSRFSETMGLTPYYRFEKLNTHHELPPGVAADPAQDKTLHTLGLEFKPIYNVVIKSDYQWTRNKARTGLNQFNVGLGYSF